VEEVFFLGLDLGTSGCRLCVIDDLGRSRALYRQPWAAGQASDPAAWWQAACALLGRAGADFPPGQCRALAVDGTSGSLLLCDAEGEPLAPVLMYHDDRARDPAARVADGAPPDSAAHGPTASLAKLLWLQEQPAARHARWALHQADWLTGRLLGRYGISDENNSLKMGYDAQRRCWPDWLAGLGVETARLPRVVPAGTPLGTLDARVAGLLGLSPGLQIIAGTTDGVAGFLASGATRVGEAVTSLGSTLVLKVLCDKAINAKQYGIYSHRLGTRWLAGGASNCGGAVLRRYFSQAELDRMTPLLDPEQPTGLDYYPLPLPGERFPVNDPEMAPRLTPRPDDPVRFYQAILEGIARVEQAGYRLLAGLGAPRPRCVHTVGGGAGNAPWTRIRARCLEVPVQPAVQQEAACGAALLARDGWLGKAWLRGTPSP